MYKISGFNLIELIITMAIIAIVVGWAIPSYQTFILASHRSDAKTALLKIQLKQENWRAGHNTYATLEELNVPVLTENKHYTLSIQLDSDNFIAIATANESQKNDRCSNFAIDRLGAIYNGYADQGCWGE